MQSHMRGWHISRATRVAYAIGWVWGVLVVVVPLWVWWSSTRPPWEARTASTCRIGSGRMSPPGARRGGPTRGRAAIGSAPLLTAVSEMVLHQPRGPPRHRSCPVGTTAAPWCLVHFQVRPPACRWSPSSPRPQQALPWPRQRRPPRAGRHQHRRWSGGGGGLGR